MGYGCIRQKEVCLFLLSKIIFILGKRACCVHGFSVGVTRLFVRPITVQQNFKITVTKKEGKE